MIIYLMIGLPASGKTTWCKNNAQTLKAVHLCKDQIRWMYANSKKDFYSRESLVTRELIQRIQYCINNEINCIIDTTNLDIEHRAKISRMIHLKPNDVVIAVNVRTKHTKCIARNNRRPERDRIENNAITRMSTQVKYVDNFEDKQEQFKYYGIIDVADDGTWSYRERGK